MKPERIRIKEGVYLNYIYTDKFKTNFASVNFITKTEEEGLSEKALLLSVLQRGSAKYPDISALNKVTDNLYGAELYSQNRICGTTQIISFKADMLANDYTAEGEDICKEVLNLMLEILFSPLLENNAFLSDYVKSEREKLRDAVKARKNDKGAYAVYKLKETLYKGSGIPASELGSYEKACEITSESLFKVYESVVYDSPVEIYFTGNYEKDKLAEIFKVIRPRKEEKPAVKDVFKDRTVKENRAEETVGAQQAKLAICCRTGTTPVMPEFAALVLLNEIFGHGLTSKLFANVREKLNLCYYCYSYLEMHPGFMIVVCGTDNGKIKAADDEIRKQFECVKNGDITESELENALKTLENTYKSVYDSASDIVSWYLYKSIYNIYEEPCEFLEKIKKSRVKDVMACAGKLTFDTEYCLIGDGSGDGEEE